MRIAVFIKSTTFHKGYGGLETQNRTLCEGLAKKGFDVTVFSPKGDVEFEEKENEGVKYVFVNAHYKRYIFSAIDKESWYKKSFGEFMKIHQKNPFDLVLSQSASAESIIDNKGSLGVKVISVAHGTAASEFMTFLKNASSLKAFYWILRNTQYFLRQFFGRQRKYILHSDRVIAVSNFVKQALINETFVSEDKVDVIHNGVDPKSFPVSSSSQGGKVSLLFLGRVEKSKGIFTILDIVKTMKPDFYLYVVGDGPDIEKARKSSPRNVVFHGRISYPDFVRCIRPDIFVFPTQRIEGFPMVLVESMFVGLPIVAFDLGGVCDAVEDGKTGYLVKAKDNSDFRKKLEDLMQNPERRVEMGSNAKEKALREFTTDKMIESYLKVIDEVLK